MSKSALIKKLSVVLLVASCSLNTFSFVHAAGTVSVSSSALNGWTPFTDVLCNPPSTVTGTVGFVSGPSAPPLGPGSLQMTTGTNGDSSVGLSNSNFNLVSLSNLTALSYSTFVSNNVDAQAPYIELVINWGVGTSADDALFFEPYLQTGGYGTYPTVTVPNQGTLLLNAWQTWNALNGGWWPNSGGTPGPPLLTLAYYLTLHPGARLVNGTRNGVVLRAGCGGAIWANFSGNINNFTIGVSGAGTTYVFGLPAPVSAASFPTPLPVPLCQDLNGTTNPVIRAQISAGTVTTGGVYCRVLAQNGAVVTSAAEIGVQSILDAGVINAVDVFALDNGGQPIKTFNKSVLACLQGTGRFIYLDDTSAPRVPASLTSAVVNGYSCANIPNPGTVVLVSH